MILRIDDTDTERSSEQWRDGIITGLDWLGVGWDGEPVSQSQRTSIYEQRLAVLQEAGATYPCFCSMERLDAVRAQQVQAHQAPRYDGTCRDISAAVSGARVAAGEAHVIRLRIPEADHGFTDVVHGRVDAPAGSFGDFILRRSDAGFMYLFCSVVDDVELGVTHVLRGEDHLPNTPRQRAILHALGEAGPQFAHLPLVRGPNGTKLSKRDPLGTLDMFMEAGYLPETVRRYAGELLGQGDADPLGIDAPDFNIESIPVGAPRLDPARLASLGQEDLARLTPDAVAAALGEQGISTEPHQLELLGELAGQSSTMGEIRAALAELQIPPDVSALDTSTLPMGAISAARTAARDDAADWPSAVTKAVREWVSGQEEFRLGASMKGLRAALTGQTSGPRLDAIIAALGRDEVVRRLDAILE